MDNLFVQLIENARKVSGNIFLEEEWEGLINTANTAAALPEPIDQLRLLIPLLYTLSSDKPKESQLIADKLTADIITTFLILAKPTSEDYDSLKIILEDILKQYIRPSNTHCSDLIKDVSALKDYKEKHAWPPTTQLFVPLRQFFSQKTGEAYIAFVSNLINLQKSGPLSNKNIDSRLKVKALMGNFRNTGEYVDFINFITQQMGAANAETKAVCELSLKTVASHLTLRRYIEIVESLSKENTEAFLTTTLPVLYEKKLKDTESRLTFIQLINQMRDRYSSPLLDSYMEKIIIHEVGQEVWEGVHRDLAEIKSLEDKMSVRRLEAEVPKSISVKALGESFSSKFEKTREDLLNKAADSTGSLSGTIEVKLRDYKSTLNKQEDFSLSKLQETASIFKEDINKTYMDFKEKVESLVNGVNAEFKKQIDANKSEKDKLNQQITSLSEKKEKNTQEIPRREQRISELKSKEKHALAEIPRLNTLAAKNFKDLKRNIERFIIAEFEKNNTDLKKNSEALAVNQAKQQKLVNPSRRSQFFSVLRGLAFWLPKKQTLEDKKKALQTLETALKEKKEELKAKSQSRDKINEQLDKISKISDKPSEEDLKAIAKFKVQFDKYLGNTKGNGNELASKILTYENNIIAIKLAQDEFIEDSKELSGLEKRIKELNDESKNDDEKEKNLKNDLESVTKTLEGLEEAYHNYKEKLMPDFLTFWQTEKGLSPEADIDFSDSQNQDVRDKLNDCISKGNLEGISQLLQKAKNWDIPDAQGNTPLQLALLNHQTDAAKFLIDQGANINLHSQGNTPLFLAYRNYADADTEEKKTTLGDLVKKLEEKGAHCVKGEMDEEKNTILHLAAKSGDKQRAIAYLEAARVDPNAQSLNRSELPVNQLNSKGETARDLAKRHGKGELMGYLIQHHEAQSGPGKNDEQEKSSNRQAFTRRTSFGTYPGTFFPGKKGAPSPVPVMESREKAQGAQQQEEKNSPKV